jgi:hypothetical protein
MSLPGKLTIAIVFWAFLVCSGFLALTVYENRPGEHGSPPAELLPIDGLPVELGRPTLVLALHPRCKCSAATLDELARISAEHHGLRTIALFYVPPDSDDGWTNTSLVETARSLPGVAVVLDEDGRLARRFNARTSGSAMFYGENGALLFSGGITLSRGHRGPNPGGSAISSWLEGRDPGLKTTPVFGCHLFGDEGRERKAS